MKLITILCSAMMATILSGCGTFSGKVGFENKCDKDIWVAHVEGFGNEPPVGALGSGLGKRANISNGNIPHEVVIHWSYKTNGADFTSKLLLDNTKMPGKDDELVFRFTNDRKWEASIMR